MDEMITQCRITMAQVQSRPMGSEVAKTVARVLHRKPALSNLLI
jgi:hypothetical protein